MYSEYIKSFFKLFNKEISLKKVYFYLVSLVTGLKKSVNIYELEKFRVKIRDANTLLNKDPVFKELSPVYVLVREKTIPYSVKFNETSEFFRINLPNVQEIPPIFTQIKWRSKDQNLTTVFRSYPLGLFTQLNVFLPDEISVENKVKLKAFNKNEIELNRKVRVMEEITHIMPYTRIVEREKLYDIPIIKEPANKVYFSEEEMDYFKEILANQTKTKKTNIEISYIFDRLNIEIYSSIKQDPKTRNLICYPDNKPVKLTKDKLYYLVIGKRKDNKVTLKALARLE